MKKFIANWLARLARSLIAKHQPKIIGITGSVGKTSTRDAIYAVVSTAFWARKPARNLNNELGLPLSVIGVDSPGRSPLGWLKVALKGYWQLWFGRFPQILVLEMGVDRPGDMDYLLSIARPDISVVTSIGIAHYEFFKSEDAVMQEKGKIVKAVASNGAVVLNGDNSGSASLKDWTDAKVINYGFSDTADVRLQIISEDFVPPGESELRVHTSTQDLSVTVPAVGVPHLASCGAAIAVGLYLGISLEKIQKGLQNYRPVPGRLSVLKGIKKTTIIDDSYNASPDSVTEALQILRRMPQQHKTAVLGDMLELGELTQKGHEEIGRLAASLQFNQLIVVGEKGRIIAEAALAAGMPVEAIVQFADSSEAAEHIREQLVPESAVLVKGSQGARMERISKELLADPMSASNVLPRQYGKWIAS